jgi:hypothetical protein
MIQLNKQDGRVTDILLTIFEFFPQLSGEMQGNLGNGFNCNRAYHRIIGLNGHFLASSNHESCIR